MKPRIAVIGTGRMGSALVEAFLKQGHSVTIWNRTKSKAELLTSHGAKMALTVMDAVDAAEMIIVSVSDYATSTQLLRSKMVIQALRGKVLIQLTSGTPSEAREMAAWAHHNAIRYLDGAIMATPNLIGEPGCTILYAGAGELFDECKSALFAIGDNAVYLGTEAGYATALDNALLSIVWGTMFGVMQGAAICEAEHFPLEAYLDSIHAIMPAVGASAADIVQWVVTGDLNAETSFGPVNLHRGGVRRLVELCVEHGLNHEVPDAFASILGSAAHAGRGQDDFAMLQRFYSAKVAVNGEGDRIGF